MSLINKMLQDLDARRLDPANGSSDGGQIRAVPVRSPARRGWWLALVTGTALTAVAAVAAWPMLRPTPSPPAPQAGIAPQPSPPPQMQQLPLRLDADINLPATTAETPAPKAPAAAVPAQAITHPGNPPVETTSRQVAPAPEPRAEKPAPAADKPSIVAKPAAAAPDTVKVKPTAVPAMPDAGKSAMTEKPAVPAVKAAPEPVAPVALHKEVKELSPQQRAENEFRKAIPLVQQGRAADAIAGLELALQLDPQHAAARQALVGVLLDSKRQDDAMRRTREGLAIEPAQPGLAMILARLQVEKGELRPGIETLQRTLPYAADQADYLAFLAALLQRDGRNKEAAEHYLHALQRSPQNGIWWMGLGISLQADSRWDEAQEAFSRARASKSLSPELLAFVESKLKQLQR